MNTTDRRHRNRGWVRSRCLLAASTLSVAVLLVGASPASANNDPHRVFLPSPPMDLMGNCAFPVHLAYPVDKEYGTITTLPDGSTVTVVTGSAVATATNEITGKTVSLNVSGPGTTTVSADGLTVTIASQGLFLDYATNGTAFGFPSNLVVTTGQWSFTAEAATMQITSVSRMPHVLIDVCAALS